MSPEVPLLAALDVVLAVAAGGGWSRAGWWKHRARDVERQLTRFEISSSEIDEGPESKPRVAFTLDPDETKIMSLGRYRNPARRTRQPVRPRAPQDRP